MGWNQLCRLCPGKRKGCLWMLPLALSYLAAPRGEHPELPSGRKNTWCLVSKNLLLCYFSQWVGLRVGLELLWSSLGGLSHYPGLCLRAGAAETFVCQEQRVMNWFLSGWYHTPSSQHRVTFGFQDQEGVCPLPGECLWVCSRHNQEMNKESHCCALKFLHPWEACGHFVPGAGFQDISSYKACLSFVKML